MLYTSTLLHTRTHLFSQTRTGVTQHVGQFNSSRKHIQTRADAGIRPQRQSETNVKTDKVTRGQTRKGTKKMRLIVGLTRILVSSSCTLILFLTTSTCHDTCTAFRLHLAVALQLSGTEESSWPAVGFLSQVQFVTSSHHFLYLHPLLYAAVDCTESHTSPPSRFI